MKQEQLLRVTGYTDKIAAIADEEITFFVHSEFEENYRSDIVRLINGDTNPEGPGLKEKVVRNKANKFYKGQHQPLMAGSYLLVPHSEKLNCDDITICAYIYPTTPITDVEGVAIGEQGLLTKWDSKKQTGYGLFINKFGSLELKIGKGRGKTEVFSLSKPLFRKVWYRIYASYDSKTGAVTVSQQAHVSITNGGHGMSMLHPREDTNSTQSFKGSKHALGKNEAPLLMAASTQNIQSGRTISGFHFKQLETPIELPEHYQKYNGKIERPRLFGSAVDEETINMVLGQQKIESLPNEVKESLTAFWDFAENINKNAASTHVPEMTPNRLHAIGINMPVRGTPGFNWSSDYMSFTHGPQEYGAIHFHDESVDDARWSPSFTFKIPKNLESGVYAARLRVKGKSTPDHEDYIPFFVKPSPEEKPADIALVMATHSYMAYANDNLSVNSVIAELLTGQIPLLQPEDLLLNKERGYGLGTYTSYRDGWGVNVSSRLRPILNMRPKYLHVLSPSLWQFNADLHLVDWLYEKGYKVDILTDEDVHKEGASLLNKYKIVLTGHHPEYMSEQQMNAYHDYQMHGGRFMYLAANGFYWICVPHPDNPNIIEVRKGDNGTRAWTISPGEYCNAFDGKHGGLWRVRGRVMSKLLGNTFSSFGLTYSSYYRRSPDSQLPQCKWIFKGIGKNEPIGDFGLVGGGAAGLELDRADLELGTPHNAFLLAHSEGHNDIYVSVTEEVTFNARGYIAGGTGETNPWTRSDIVYFKTPNEGAVFSVGSMTWCGSLQHNNYNNNVSTMMSNVIDGFLKYKRLP